MSLDPATFTAEEFDAIEANGCGGKGGWVKVPDHVWADDCNAHDAAYWIGGSRKDRKQADADFYDATLTRCDDAGHDWYHRLWSWSYFRAVRIFGGQYFHSGTQRTRADLDRAVAEYKEAE